MTEGLVKFETRDPVLWFGVDTWDGAKGRESQGSGNPWTPQQRLKFFGIRLLGPMRRAPGPSLLDAFPQSSQDGTWRAGIRALQVT